MQTIAQGSIEKELGKGSALFPKRMGKMSYLYGVDTFDQVKVANPSAIDNPLIITVLPGGLQLSILNKLKAHYAGLPMRDIRAVELKLPQEITCSWEQSILGRAVVGGLRLGPVGALLGALSGLQATTYTQGLLTIAVEQQGVESFFVASVEPGLGLHQVQAFLKKHLGQFYQP